MSESFHGSVNIAAFMNEDFSMHVIHGVFKVKSSPIVITVACKGLFYVQSVTFDIRHKHKLAN